MHFTKAILLFLVGTAFAAPHVINGDESNNIMKRELFSRETGTCREVNKAKNECKIFSASALKWVTCGGECPQSGNPCQCK
ncbi:unnamed protein product [Clonostachys byssicola]|uniref:Uncharacterized protein n=1 Tax=Clonostachys byssicola TaxID=160290 RepID=A0A9N9UC19_9HYPO|nr:unnamed protein product [Clonostachys byssicola]